ncbi:MAG: hypothetical protein AAFZ65_21105, partial [Planctomycetota bacterium]
LTFTTQRFEPEDYALLLRIRPSRTLGQLFLELVDEGWLDLEDEDSFYQFVLELHKSRLLKLPVADDKLLLKRAQQRRKQERRSLWMSPLFYKRKLFDPDDFLSRTEHLVRPCFTRWAFAIWVVTVVAAAAVALMRADELVAPLGQILLASNLPLLWVALVGLKVVHELGHAYATRRYGGEVPEIGLNLIVLTPLPYVDASAAWSFPSKLQRLIVSSAGMYVEFFVASLALFVWASTEASLLNAFAYLVAFTGSVVTLLFNLNPLMRFDGYYILSDLIEVPNLRQRSTALVQDWARRLFFGLPQAVEERGLRLQAMLGIYGVSSGIYKITLVLGLSAGVALKYPALGLALAAGYILMELAKLGRGLWATIREVNERELGRAHGAIGLLLLFIALPWAVAAVPVPGWIAVPATAERAELSTVHAEVSGFLEPLGHWSGDSVATGEALVRISEPEEAARLAEGAARLESARLDQMAALAGTGGELAQASAALRYIEQEHAWREQTAAKRRPRSPV